MKTTGRDLRVFCHVARRMILGCGSVRGESLMRITSGDSSSSYKSDESRPAVRNAFSKSILNQI